MASVKIKFRPSRVEGNPGSVYYQVIHNRESRIVKTGYKLYPSEWDPKEQRPAYRGVRVRRVGVLGTLIERIESDKRLFANIIASLAKEGDFTVDMVVDRFNLGYRQRSFSYFMQSLSDDFKKVGKVRTSETYVAALRSFMAFRGNADVMVDSIDSEMIMLYEGYLKKRGLSMNTISFYMRILRAAYNRAVDRNLTVQRNPFKNVYTGVDKTLKRAIPFRDVKRLKCMDFTTDASLDFARDMFLFSFYTRGMSFVDMAYLSKRNLRDGMLIYRRRKTGQRLFIKWESCMQEIVDKYPACPGGRLLPIIRREGDERQQYENALHLVNKKLKKVAARVGLSTRLSMYVARHSWASVAKSQNIPIAVISEGMGHDSENTTRIYLASLDNSVIDRANGLILRKL